MMTTVKKSIVVGSANLQMILTAINALAVVIGPLVLVYMQNQSYEALRERDKIAAEKVQEVKKDLVSTNTVTARKLDVIHSLTNSALEAQLQVTMVALKRVADLTKESADYDAYSVAKIRFESHQKEQRAIDAKAGFHSLDNVTPPVTTDKQDEHKD